MYCAKCWSDPCECDPNNMGVMQILREHAEKKEQAQSGLSKSDITKIKKNIEYWGNNCGGCEECGRVFGDKELTFDMMTVYELIQVIEDQEKKILKFEEKEEKILELEADKIPCGPRDGEMCGNTKGGFYQCRNHWNFYHKDDK